MFNTTTSGDSSTANSGNNSSYGANSLAHATISGGGSTTAPEGVDNDFGFNIPDLGEGGGSSTSGATGGDTSGGSASSQDSAGSSSSADQGGNSWLDEWKAFQAQQNGGEESTDTDTTEESGGEPGAGASDGDGTDAGGETRFDKHPRFQQLVQQRNVERQAREQLEQQFNALQNRLAQLENAQQQATANQSLEEQLAGYEQQQYEIFGDNDNADAIVAELVGKERERLEAVTWRQQEEAKWNKAQQERARERNAEDFQSAIKDFPIMSQTVNITDSAGVSLDVSAAMLVSDVVSYALSGNPDTNVREYTALIGNALNTITENRAKQLASEQLESFFKQRGSNPGPVKPAATAPIMTNRGGGGAPSPIPPAETQRLDGNLFGDASGVFANI